MPLLSPSLENSLASLIGQTFRAWPLSAPPSQRLAFSTCIAAVAFDMRTGSTLAPFPSIRAQNPEDPFKP